MLKINENKLTILEKELIKEFLYDLVYEIIKENEILKLNENFNKLLDLVNSLIYIYNKKGITQIYTLKYMVKSHVILGCEYDQDIFYAWLINKMQDHNSQEQLTYVNAFYEILEDYKDKVIGNNYINVVNALSRIDGFNKLKNIDEQFYYLFPEKVDYLKNLNVFEDLVSKYKFHNLDKEFYMEFIVGRNFKNNIFYQNFLNIGDKSWV